MDAGDAALRRRSAVFSKVPQAIVIQDLEGRVIDANEAAAWTLGRTREELLGRSLATLLPEEQRGAIAQLVSRSLAGESLRDVAVMLGNEPRSAPALLTLMPLSGPSGDPEVVAIFLRDASELRVDTAFRDHIERHLEPVIWLLQPDPLRIFHVSRSYEAIWGRPVEGLFLNPRDWLEAIHPDDRRRTEIAFEGLLRGEPYDVEYRILRGDGEVRWIRARGTAYSDAGNELNRAAGVVEDITERRETDAALRRMSAGFSGAADPILILDLEGNITDCNQAALDTYDHSREELIGRSSVSLVPPDARAETQEWIARCCRGEPVRNVETLRRTREGRAIPVLLTLSLITDASGKASAIVSVAKDISALRQARNLRRSAAQAEERAEARERRGLARDLHDAVSQPLVLARTRLAALRDELGTLGQAEQLRDIESLVAEAEERTRTLTFRLSPPVLHDIGLAAAAEWLAEDLEHRFGLHVSVSDDELPKPLDAAAREAVFRSLRELLINVARHARTDEANVSLSRSDDQLVLTVTDGGIGFDLTRNRAGFGLVSVRERIESLEGRLEIESELGRGAHIRLTVPL